MPQHVAGLLLLALADFNFDSTSLARLQNEIFILLPFLSTRHKKNRKEERKKQAKNRLDIVSKHEKYVWWWRARSREIADHHVVSVEKK